MSDNNPSQFSDLTYKNSVLNNCGFDFFNDRSQIEQRLESYHQTLTSQVNNKNQKTNNKTKKKKNDFGFYDSINFYSNIASIKNKDINREILYSIKNT